ncbi:hypothetical protein [Geminocystis herdmanii]|uniref:hypothetical protein n=1 Tax=Geminocystis herdmanii TaxID=669359 RepID=UPI000344BAB3|nr:hypothetical protein [Geminocystis herdmanii]
MLSTDIKQEIILKRIENIVSILMDKEPFFKEDLDYRETVHELVTRLEKNKSLEEFNGMSDEELKDFSSSIMSLNMLAKVGESFTPQQMAIFDEAIKRK